VWKNAKEVKKTKKIRFYKITAAPVLMCGSENWALSRSERREIETAQMSFLRRVSGYVLTDLLRSMIIRNALQVYALEGTIKEYKKHLAYSRLKNGRFRD
jgi:hypothetical protein